jgi:hypothetical protein
MTQQDRLRAHRVAARKGIEKWIVVWTAMHPEEALREGEKDRIAMYARGLLGAMKDAERAAEAERLNAIPVLRDDRETSA